VAYAGTGAHSLEPTVDFDFDAVAAISKSLLTFKDEIGFMLSAGKSDGSRDRFSRAQKASVANGDHWSSTHSRKRKAA
jgi:hypothetical protein